VQTPGFAVFV